MRREWSAWIKSRDWGEFEKLAKADPSQPLADTIAELERGFTEKSDRKALRKVLFVLAQRGVRPQPLPTEAPAVVEKKPEIRSAFMMSADGRGDSLIIYGRQSGDKVRWLHASTNVLTGISDASEEVTSVEEAVIKVASILGRVKPPMVVAPVDVTFALGRLSTALALGKPVPPVMAFWRSQIDGQPQGPHPAEKIERKATTPDERIIPALGLDASLMWRLELGLASPILVELSQLHQKSLSETERKEATDKILGDARERIFTPSVVLDFSTRLLDLAYILSLQQNEHAGLLASTADDFRERGGESDYARGLLDKSVMLLVETLRKREEATQ